MSARVSPPSLVCPRCHATNAFASAACSECGGPLRALANDADTVEVTPLEQDPQTLDLWSQLREATLGEYDVYAPIGRGGMATVFLALDLALEREVAIKVISPDMLQTKSVVERFKREARTAANLSHPNIIPVHQVKEVNGLVFFVMKYIDGRSLDSIIREEGAVGFDLVMSVLTQVGNALHFAHRKGVVHRDVKPANVMVDQDGWVVVTDFGIAKVADSGALTSAGMIVGTPAYMSPEQFGGQAITGAADQYSLGVVGYEMLTGKTPFTATSVGEMMRAHLIDNAAAPRALRPDVPPALSDVIMRMLEKEPARRWPSIGEALAALEPLSRAREESARALLMSLAKSGAQQRPRISVPVSPVPTRRATVDRIPSVAPARANTWRRSAVALAVVAVTIAGGAWLAKRPGRAAIDPGSASQLAQRDSVQPPAPVVPSGQVQTASAPKVPGGRAGASAPGGRGKAPIKDAVPRQGEGDSRQATKLIEGVRPQASADSQRAAQAVTKAGGAAAAPLFVPLTPPVTPDTSAVRSAAPVAPAEAYVRIGSKIPNAVLYLDGKAEGFLGALKFVKVGSGAVRIGVHADGCRSWDSVVSLAPRDTLRINYRNPVCSP